MGRDEVTEGNETVEFTEYFCVFVMYTIRQKILPSSPRKEQITIFVSQNHEGQKYSIFLTVHSNNTI